MLHLEMHYVVEAKMGYELTLLMSVNLNYMNVVFYKANKNILYILTCLQQNFVFFCYLTSFD